MTSDEAEEPEVRTASYSALLYAYKGESARREATDFEPMGDKSLAYMDALWLSRVDAWSHDLASDRT